MRALEHAAASGIFAHSAPASALSWGSLSWARNMSPMRSWFALPASVLLAAPPPSMGPAEKGTLLGGIVSGSWPRAPGAKL